MNRIITSFRKANKDLLKFILEEYPDGVEDDSLVNFPKAAGGSIRALEIVMNNHIYLVKMDEEEYYQKYLAKEEDQEEGEEDMDDDLDVDEVEVDEEVEEEDDEKN
jgi:Tfp pilus assembly pilus retraction ATPase PilT